MKEYGNLDDLWGLIGAIPKGRVATYGSIGAALRNPASGFMVGRWMAQCPEGLPWWRVVAKSGLLPIQKRDPYMEMDQRRLLEREGVTFVEGRIDMDRYQWQPE